MASTFMRASVSSLSARSRSPGTVSDPDGTMWEAFLTEGVVNGAGYGNEEMPLVPSQTAES